MNISLANLLLAPHLCDVNCVHLREKFRNPCLYTDYLLSLVPGQRVVEGRAASFKMEGSPLSSQVLQCFVLSKNFLILLLVVHVMWGFVLVIVITSWNHMKTPRSRFLIPCLALDCMGTCDTSS